LQNLPITSPAKERIKDQRMAINKTKNDSSIHRSHFRAEDGMQQPGNRGSLTEGVLIPLGSLGAIVLAMLGMMLLNR
jgi:hypothetical protein